MTTQHLIVLEPVSVRSGYEKTSRVGAVRTAARESLQASLLARYWLDLLFDGLLQVQADISSSR